MRGDGDDQEEQMRKVARQVGLRTVLPFHATSRGNASVTLDL